MLNKKVALLATGNEIVNGELLNTNAQAIAKALFDQGIEVGHHLSVMDDQWLIEQAIIFLLSHHEALITIGGLGPTSDDKTRFAVSAVAKQPLVFHQPSWEALAARLSHIGLEVVESNRQQALFPKGAKVIPNPYGTAAACKVLAKDKLIYMLPGPPNECLPIFNECVLADLIQQQFQVPVARRSWLLLGLSEGNLAHHLDAIIDHQQCQIAYRVNHPYLELKLAARSSAILQAQIDKVMPFILEAIVSEQCQTASAQLIDFLLAKPWCFGIDDRATGGSLQTTLLTPQTQAKFSFSKEIESPTFRVQIRGLDEYWQHTQAAYTELSLAIDSPTQTYKRDFSIRYGKRDIRTYAVELLCWELLKFLRGQ